MTKTISLVSGQALTPVNYSMQQEYEFDADSVPAAHEAWRGTLTLSAGSLTITLEALTRPNQTALDLTGFTVIAMMVINPAGNGALTVVPAAANPYPIWGSPTGRMVIAPGGCGGQVAPTDAGWGTVSTTVSDITFTGTGTQSFTLGLVARDVP